MSDAALTCLTDSGIRPLDNDFPAFGKPYEQLTCDEWSLIRNITEQRHKALNWVCGLAPGNNYDETPTNT